MPYIKTPENKWIHMLLKKYVKRLVWRGSYMVVADLFFWTLLDVPLYANIYRGFDSVIKDYSHATRVCRFAFSWSFYNILFSFFGIYYD
jgi:hypothetical protein